MYIKNYYPVILLRFFMGTFYVDSYVFRGLSSCIHSWNANV